jgi:2-succinyl-6-hydroxy-2,4-cyclohexadiene-1-carboxylate synthase
MSLLRVQRQGTGPTFVWLHGFTQTGASAYQFRSILTGTNQLWIFDLPGHGDAAEIDASLDETADLVAELLPDEPVALGGYSMGARVALHVALRHPSRLSSLVVLGASRGIEDPKARAERRQRDDQLADRIETVGAEAFLDEWLAQPLFANVPDDPFERVARSANPHGLAASLRRSGTGTQDWLDPRLSALDVPTLALAGANDAKFIIEASAIAARVQHGTSYEVRDAGHAAHLEQPERTAEQIVAFLND